MSEPRVPLTDAEIDVLESAMRGTVIAWPEYGEDNPPLSWSIEDGHVRRLIADLRATRAELAALRESHDWLEAIAHTARLMLQRAPDDPVQQELRALLADELLNLTAAEEATDA